MYAFITILIVLIALLIMAVVLVQNPKGGGLGAGFGGGGGGGGLGGGVQNTTDFLERATWVLAVLFLTLALVSNIFLPGSSNSANTIDGSVQDIELNDRLLEE